MIGNTLGTYLDVDTSFKESKSGLYLGKSGPKGGTGRENQPPASESCFLKLLTMSSFHFNAIDAMNMGI